MSSTEKALRLSLLAVQVAGGLGVAARPALAAPALNAGAHVAATEARSPTPAPAKKKPPPLATRDFPDAPKNEAGQDLIRVRILSAPGGRDNGGAVAIVGACRTYAAAAAKSQPVGPESGASTRFELTRETLKQPVYLRCPDGAEVRRRAPLPSRRYLGDFYVRIAPGSATEAEPRVEIVNIVPLETYLRGVVPLEIVPSWPIESLRAQAIAARTFAYFNMAHDRAGAEAKVFDVDDTPAFQVYNGVSKVARATDKAIADTAGIVMHVGGKAILTFFHADSGGHTATAAEVFDINAPYCAAKREPETLGPPIAWRRIVKLQDLARRLGTRYVPTGQKIAAVDIDPSDRSASGRTRAVTVTLGDGVKVKVGSVDFKRAAGGLVSSLYSILAHAPDAIRIDGRGRGHGVGLSQRSAKDMASKGWSHGAILEFFYDGAKLCRLTKASGPASKVQACRD